MRTLALLGAMALFGLLVAMAVAGVTAATAVLVTGAALIGMIGLGGRLAGRTGRSRP